VAGARPARARAHGAVRAAAARLHAGGDRRRGGPQPPPAVAQRQRVRGRLLRLGRVPRDGRGGAPRPALSPHRDLPDDARGPPPAGGDVQPPGDPRRRPVDGRVRLPQLPHRVRLVPHALADADRGALRRHPGGRRAGRALHRGGAHQRVAPRLRGRRDPAYRRQPPAGDVMDTNSVAIIVMVVTFLYLGYQGVPVAFALIAGALVTTAFFTKISLP